MLSNYKELAKDFIDIKVYLKEIKLFLKDVFKELDLELKINIDKIGIGCGPIVSVEHENFILKVYSGSFGSSDKIGQCFVMVQSICNDMPEPYDLGNVIRYSLPYYANNPKYLINNIEKIKRENNIWKKLKPHMLKDKWIQQPEKYFLKIEKSLNNFSTYLESINFNDTNKIYSYWTKLKNLYYTTKQKLINTKKLSCEYSVNLKNFDFVPFKHFSNFAKKQKCSIFGKTKKYFYNKKTQILFCCEHPTTPIKFIGLKKSKLDKYYKKLNQSDFNTHSKLFKVHKILFLKTTKIYIF